LQAQKVGLVFSGGGAKGLAHIGVLKALEENHIPIDYITGTSMGAIVGGMYAAGYTPTQIEKIALSTQFQDWVNGRYQSDYSFFFQKTSPTPSAITAKMAIDSSMRISFRPALVNDIPLNFAMVELFSQATAVARGNFNNLMVPFRCMTSDVLSHEAIMLSRGSLSEAIRASMSVPLVYRPVKINDKFVFDGGIYNNFPGDIMQKEFHPDIIIGANVSSNTFHEYPKDDERLINRFLMYMILGKSDSTLVGKNGIYIEPDLSKFSALDFIPVADLIEQGYQKTIAKMPEIKARILHRMSAEELAQKRDDFNAQKKPLQFKNIIITGVNSQQKKYIQRVFKIDDSVYQMKDIKRGYFKLVADEAFESVYPRVTYDRLHHHYNFELVTQVQKKLKLDFGGNISSRPISNVFLGLQLNHINRKAYTLTTNFYSGRFYEAAQANTRIDFPTKLPLYVAADFTYNHWNFYNTSKIFVENPSITYIDQADGKFDFKIGFPLNGNARISFSSAFISNFDSYSPDNTYLAGDIFDRTKYDGYKAELAMEKNSLNRKQYPSKGQNILLSASFLAGHFNYEPGNYYQSRVGLLNPPQASKTYQQWYRLRFNYEYYFLSTPKYSLGYLVEATISNQPLSVNYYSTLLTAPSFYPLQDSRSLFLANFKAHQYVAGGLKNVISLTRKLDWRIEGYVFLPYQAFRKVGFQDISYEPKFDNLRVAGTSALVYQSPLGPVSFSYNFYDDSTRRHGVLLHIGYLIYNKRSLE
jgi:NTE family protein